ncbi:MAG TPA: hypothetical protein VK709_00305 [Candidatus Saccharimonadales bacterium]|jgi:hypothetical protein|nr:hypothetical protein [Candidatus Saccharimonadales bacterium]
MVIKVETAQAKPSQLEEASPFLLPATLLGIPAAGSVALAFLLQIPRLIYGEAMPLALVAEVGSLISVVVQVYFLRACLKLPSAPNGFYRNVLDFLAMSRWHPSAKAALAGLIVLPQVWFFSRGNFWAIEMFRQFGRSALHNGDVQVVMDDVAVIYQLALTGGVPLLFALHMFSRWKPRSRVLPWVLVPLLFMGTAVGVVIVGTIMHFSN